MLSFDPSRNSGKAFKFLFSFRFLFVVLAVVVFSVSGYSETLFRVSGKVLWKGKGVYKAYISVVRIDKSFTPIQKECVTDENGDFFLYLSPGKYSIICDVIKETRFNSNTNDYYDEIVGPKVIVVKNKNINNIIYKLMTYKEIITANKDILKRIPDTVKKIKYCNISIPLYSLSSCKKTALDNLEYIKENNSSVLKGSILGEPIPFYDLDDNPIVYLFPIKKNNVEIGVMYISANTLNPKLIESGYLESDKEIAKVKDKKEGVREWIYNKIVKTCIEKTAKKVGCDINDIVLKRLLYLPIYNKGKKYLLLEKTSTKQRIIVNFVGDIIITEKKLIDEIKKFSEEFTIFNIIEDIAYDEGLELRR